MLRLIFAAAATAALTAFTWHKRKLIRAMAEELLDRGIELTVNNRFWPSKSGRDTDIPIVYVTNGGSKYHRFDCRFLNGNAKAIAIDKAAEAYAPCGICFPDGYVPRSTATGPVSQPEA